MSDPKPELEEGKLLLVNVPQKRWWKLPFKLFGFLLLTGITAGAAGYGFVSWKYSDGLPEIPKVDAYRPPILTEVYTVDGVLAGEFYNERRKVVPYERIPKRLVQALPGGGSLFLSQQNPNSTYVLIVIAISLG